MFKVSDSISKKPTYIVTNTDHSKGFLYINNNNNNNNVS